MATMVLAAAGAAVGGSMGGAVAGIGAAAIGRVGGAVIGGMVDQRILGQGAAAVETGRVEDLRFQGAAEGEPVTRVFGRMRVGGQLIWASRFLEHVDTSRRGGKGGGQKVREFSYTASFAVALCEGPGASLRRIWADGREMPLDDIVYRYYDGDESQEPDPLIDQVEGGAPAFRGAAYVVFEDLPLGDFGNRIPQISAEIVRTPPPAADQCEVAEDGVEVEALTRGVALSPGAGEFALATTPVERDIGPGRRAFENVNTASGQADFDRAIDQLVADAPSLQAASLVVTWFGDDLRCGECLIRPLVDNPDKKTKPLKWKVSGLDRAAATVVSTDVDGRPNFGGTPADIAVIEAIRALNARGIKVMLYPFILMDVPAGNGKPDPWTGASDQPTFPWRGRITLSAAPGTAGSPDKTTAATSEVENFFGTAAPGDFGASGDEVTYSGPAEWSYRRFILHLAKLGAVAGGLNAFCIGSEMRSLTQIRSAQSAYPAVDALCALVDDVRAILGSAVRIGYAADWSEYFGHHAGDGSGDVHFHLDPLWSHPEIDFVGIDNYMPLADWRYEDDHADAAAGSVYALDYLKSNIAGGEGFDWYYASEADREAQVRTPIVDTAHGEDWIFRVKDLVSWWSSPHHNRPGGVRDATPTAWTPESKQIWFTEIGCPSVDLGVNQPNVFYDERSSEGGLPYFSRGRRDVFIQRRYLQAIYGYWNSSTNNPSSSVYSGRMLHFNRIFAWTWDARPWPEFPERVDVWSDGPNHRLGHWLTGRLRPALLCDVVADICARAGLWHVDVSDLTGVVDGFALSRERTARQALQALMTAYAFDAFESGGRIIFRMRTTEACAEIRADALVADRRGAASIERSRAAEGEIPSAVRLSFAQSDAEFETGAVEARRPGAGSVESVSLPLALDASEARHVARRWLAEANTARDTVSVDVGRCAYAIEPGDVVDLVSDSGAVRYRVDGVDERLSRGLKLTRVERLAYTPAPSPARRSRKGGAGVEAPMAFEALDLPIIDGTDAAAGARIAAFSAPWPGEASIYLSPDEEGFAEVGQITRPSVIGALAAPAPFAAPDRWTRDCALDVVIYGGGLSSASETAVLNGVNLAALRSPSGQWELLQFREAELIDADTWRLTHLLRGQYGTETFIGDPTPEGATFVLLDGSAGAAPLSDAARGAMRRIRVGPSGRSHTDALYTEAEVVFDGVHLRPFAPAHLKAQRTETGDIEISWIRRARHSGDTWEGIDPPLCEDREAYRVALSKSGGVERVVETTQPGCTYTAADEAADGGAGALTIRVAQISDQFGPGPEAEATFND